MKGIGRFRGRWEDLKMEDSKMGIPGLVLI
jgi:hypothetical protein